MSVRRFVKKAIQAIRKFHIIRVSLCAVHIPFAWILIRSLGMFDKEWYVAQYVGNQTRRYQQRFPLLHYIVVGRSRGLSPSPFFIGEYYDPEGWHVSIFDPLVRYILRKNTWKQATSLLFNGRAYYRQNAKLPPLYYYLRKIREEGDANLFFDYFDTAGNQTKRWSDIKAYTLGQVTVRTDQHEYREKAEPSKTFDFQLEHKTIQKTASYTFGDTEPLVSIIMPAWNRQDLIGPAIESAQAQSYAQWELLIIDDGSTDKTVDIVRSYQKDDSRIKLFTPGHGGVCRARNHGIQSAEGDWVAFLDSDNTWTKHFLRTSLALLSSNKQLASYSAIKMEIGSEVRYRTTQPNPKLLESGNFVDLNALIVAKKLLDKVGYFDESLRRMVDYDLVIRVAKEVSFQYVPIIGVNYSDHPDLMRISTTESINWDGVVKNNNFIAWESLRVKKRKKLTSIIVPVRGDVLLGTACVRQILRLLKDRCDIEIIIVDASGTSALNTTLSSFSLIDNRVKYRREPGCRDVVLATNYGFAMASGDKIVVVQQHIQVEEGWLDRLLIALSDENIIASPLQLQEGRLIHNAGLEFYSDLTPVRILADHPSSDTKLLSDVLNVPSIASDCFTTTAQVFAELRGLNPLYSEGLSGSDMALRAERRWPNKSVVVAKQSVVINERNFDIRSAALEQLRQDWSGHLKPGTSSIWEQAGFAVDAYAMHELSSNHALIAIPVLRNKQLSGSYRWAIKISAPADDRRFMWGDYYYGLALADALERLGQTAVIDFHDFHDRRTKYLDDILLDLRGLDSTKPQQDALNIMWVISHPEKVTHDIVNSFDLVFAAGKVWAAHMTEESNKTVGYLPQCTDPTVFHPTKKDNRYKGRIIFVANSRNVRRPIIDHAIAAGVDVDVYGAGWEGIIDKKYIKGTFIPNEELAQAYSSAAAILNDHWDDMREWGFISNRIFDVLGAGGRVVTDDVKGLRDTVVSDGVMIYQTEADLRDILSSHAWQSVSAEDATVSATYIKENHSFDMRAKQLLDSVKTAKKKQEKNEK